MYVLEAAMAWGYSIERIREFCRYGFIPGAIKKHIWVIPDDAEKPPVTVNAFVVLMESITEYKEGGDPNVYRKGLPKEKIKDALYYLSGFGFIAGYDETIEYPECVRRASLLQKSCQVIIEYRGRNNMPKIENVRGVQLGPDFLKVHAEKKTVY